MMPVLLATGQGMFFSRGDLRESGATMIQRIQQKKTTASQVARYRSAVQRRLEPDFQRLGLNWPPDRIVLAGFKQEKKLEMWIAAENGPYRLLRTYPVQGASGTLGPKLREGDMQVPEGVYRIESLNPNSRFHLALRINYPNPSDLARAGREGRQYPGGDIMIHGESGSAGCLAMGNEAAEDLFVLAAETGIDHIQVILSPVDFRKHDLPAEMPPLPGWMAEVYRAIREALAPLKPPAE